jgi:RNA ligase
MLLTRDNFREKVLERDAHKCVLCPNPAVGAHHILDRSLFDDGGYYLSNGVSLCSEHHLLAEKTLISCERLREAAGITEIIQPEHFYADDKYDHWGNTVLPNGTRLKGELFGNENVQKILKEAGVLDSFIKYIHYPRTYHCPWSENLQNDDRRHENINFLLNKQVVVSVKLDGENSSLYNDNIHARSVNSTHHESRSWLKALHGKIAHDIPEGFRICGENMYAKHSIYYQHLKSYFYAFSIWNESNIALSWNETCEYANLLGLQVVPVLCRGIYSSIEELRNAIDTNIKGYSETCPDEIEGYVIRLAGPIAYKDFRLSTAKAVRKHHVATSTHWMSEKVIPNKIEV